MTYSNVTSLFDYHWRAGLSPMATTVMAALSGWLLPRGTTVEVNRDEYVKPDPLTRAQTWQILITLGVLTAEQVAEIERFSVAAPPPNAHVRSAAMTDTETTEDVQTVARAVGPMLYRAAGEMTDVRFPDRTIEVVAHPYNEEAIVPWSDGRIVSEICDPGAYNGIERRAARIHVNRDHDRGTGRAADTIARTPNATKVSSPSCASRAPSSATRPSSWPPTACWTRRSGSSRCRAARSGRGIAARCG